MPYSCLDPIILKNVSVLKRQVRLSLWSRAGMVCIDYYTTVAAVLLKRARNNISSAVKTFDHPYSYKITNQIWDLARRAVQISRGGKTKSWVLD